MEISDQIDSYCERMDFGLWAEPWNLVSNAAFVIAAVVIAYRLRGQAFPLAWALVALLTAISIGSALWHSFATVWAMLTDVIPIALFILVYVFAVHRDVLGWRGWQAGAAIPIFLLYSFVVGTGAASVPFFEISAGYWPIALALPLYALWLRHRAPDVARGFLLATGLLCLSLVSRSIDEGLCDTIPRGTHFLWHVFNGLLLGWLIEVYRRHMLATRRSGG